MKTLLLSLLLLSPIACLAETTNISTTTLAEVRQKVVQLEITFTPAQTAIIKKQRKIAFNKTGQALCSGALVSDDGFILTARHCAEGATVIDVMLSDGQVYAATIRKISKTQDLALLRISKFRTPFFVLGYPPEQNDNVWIIGNPLGLLNLLTSGIVAKLYGDNVLLDCTAVPGNSGGPVINSKGQLVGILTAMIMVEAGPSHITMAQSVDSILSFFVDGGN